MTDPLFSTYGGLFDSPEMRNMNAQSVLGGMAQGLLAAGGPSQFPIDIGTALGHGISGGIQANQNQFGQMQQMMQMRSMMIQQQMMKAAMEAPDPGQPSAYAQPQTGGMPTPLQSGGGSSGAENPYNIGNVEAPKGSPTRFAQPQSWGEGVKLTLDTARAYSSQFNNGKPMTLDEIAAKWAPTKGVPEAEAALNKNWPGNVALGSGLSRDQPLNLDDPETAAKFARGVHLAEKNQKTSPIQPVQAYVPGAQGPIFQMAQAGGTRPLGNTGTNIPDVPPPPPLVIPQKWQLMKNTPMRPLAEAKIKELEQQHEDAWKRYNANIELRKLQMDERKSLLTPSGEQNTPLIGAQAAQEKAKTEAKVQAEQEAIMPPELKDKSGPELLKAMPANMRTMVDMLYHGDLPITQLQQRSGLLGLDPSKTNFEALTKRAYPDWTPAKGEAAYTMRKDVWDRSKQIGQLRASLNVFYQHVDQYQDLMKAREISESWDSPAVNHVLEIWNTQHGDNQFTNPRALQHFLATEAARAVRGTGALNKEEVDAAEANLSTVQTWKQAKGALNVWTHAIGAREKDMMESADELKIPQEESRAWFTPSARAAKQHFEDVQKGKGETAPAAAAPKYQEGQVAGPPGKPPDMIFKNGKWQKM